MSKDDVYEGMTRVKHSLSKILPFDAIRETEILLNEIKEYLAI